jgi:hypothetical protein
MQQTNFYFESGDLLEALFSELPEDEPASSCEAEAFVLA